MQYDEIEKTIHSPVAKQLKVNEADIRPDWSLVEGLGADSYSFIEPHKEQLFVTCRLKDVLVVRGRNYYPQEIERAAETSDTKLRPNCTAAFTIPKDGVDRLVVVCEVSRVHSFNWTPVIRAIRHGVATP